MRLFQLATSALALTLMTAAGAARAGDMSQHAVVGDMDVYYGLVPAAQMPDQDMLHAGKRPEKDSQHLVVALVDSKNGKHIVDAEVRAAIAPLGLSGQWKKLEPMTVAQAVTYGQYFSLEGSGIYRLQLSVRRQGMEPLTAGFELTRP